MSSSDFNLKWNNYLKKNCSGLQIEDSTVIYYLDAKFQKEILHKPNFVFSQIKIKFGSCRIYCNSSQVTIWEKEIDNLLH